MRSIRSIAPWLCASLLVAACASTEKMEEKVLAAAPAPNAGFLEDPNQLKPDTERAPVNRMWAAPVAVGVPLGTVAAFTDQGYVAFEMRCATAAPESRSGKPPTARPAPRA